MQSPVTYPEPDFAKLPDDVRAFHIAMITRKLDILARRADLAVPWFEMREEHALGTEHGDPLPVLDALQVAGATETDLVAATMIAALRRHRVARGIADVAASLAYVSPSYLTAILWCLPQAKRTELARINARFAQALDVWKDCMEQAMRECKELCEQPNGVFTAAIARRSLGIANLGEIEEQFAAAYATAV